MTILQNYEHYLIFSIVFIVSMLEWRFGFRKYFFLSKHHLEDGFWLLLNLFFYPVFFTYISFETGTLVSNILAGYHEVFILTKQNMWIQLLFLILSTDLLSYWIHRLFHSLSLFWDMHRLHHSAKELTILSSFRVSWLERFLFSLFIGLASGVFLVDENIRLVVSFLFSVVCYIQHTNLPFKYPAVLEKIIITPKNHYWHHSTYLHTKSGQNFGFLFPWWDMIFNTLYNPDHYETEIGLADEFKYKNFAHQFFYPLSKWIGLDKLINK